MALTILFLSLSEEELLKASEPLEEEPEDEPLPLLEEPLSLPSLEDPESEPDEESPLSDELSLLFLLLVGDTTLLTTLASSFTATCF